MARLGAKRTGPGQIIFGIVLAALIGGGLYLAFRPSETPPTPEAIETPATDATPVAGGATPAPALDVNGTPLPPELAALQTPLPEATPIPSPTPTKGAHPSETVAPTPQETGKVPRVEEGVITNATPIPTSNPTLAPVVPEATAIPSGTPSVTTSPTPRGF